MFLRSKIKSCGISIKICVILLGFLFFPTFISSLLFIVNIGINIFVFPISIFLLLCLYYMLFYDSHKKFDFYFPLILSILIIISLTYLSSVFGEFSWDGWAYHSPAIIRLKDGWNPIYQHIEEYGKWSVHYPKFIWIYSAVLYKTFGNLFVGTSFNSIIIISNLFLSIDILRKMKLTRTFSIILGLILSFNVIAVGQLFSYYNDGVLGNCVWGLLLIFYTISKRIYKFDKNYILIFIIVVYSSILANIKFTGALIVFLIILFYFIYLFIKKIVVINKFFIVSILCIGFSILSIGLTTYLPNYVHHNNIGYPLLGDNKEDIITDLTPNMLVGDNKYKALLKSITYDNEYSIYKYNPFYIISKKAIKNTPTTDCRIGGFGPYFQSIILSVALVIVISIIKFVREKIKNNSLSTINIKHMIKESINELLLITIILIITIITPAIWWARYVPYLYIFPIILLILFKKRWSNLNIGTLICYLVVFIYFIQIPIYMTEKLYNQRKTYENFQNNMKVLSNLSTNEKIDISFYDYKNQWYKELVRNELLKNYDINYIERDQNSCIVVDNYDILGISLLDCTNQNK